MFDVPRNITFVRGDRVYKMEKKFFLSFYHISQCSSNTTQDKEISFSITPNRIKSNWGNRVFPWIKILLGTAAFMLLQNLIFTSVRVKWLLLRSICGIDGTQSKRFYVRNICNVRSIFHSSQFCVASSCFGYIVYTSNFTN